MFNDTALQFCLTVKFMFGLGLRQATRFAGRFGEARPPRLEISDYGTLSRSQKTLGIAITARPSQGGLHLLIDSTGVKRLGEGERKTRKHGAEYRQEWRKMHMGIDAQTLGIRAIEITDNAIGDAPMLPELLAQIPAEERLHPVGAEDAYSHLSLP